MRVEQLAAEPLEAGGTNVRYRVGRLDDLLEVLAASLADGVCERALDAGRFVGEQVNDVGEVADELDEADELTDLFVRADAV